MTTIQEANSAYAAACEKVKEAKFPTGYLINLNSPEGNVFYILGLARSLARQFDVLSEFKDSFKDIQRTSYQEILDKCQEWFGFVYIHRK